MKCINYNTLLKYRHYEVPEDNNKTLGRLTTLFTLCPDSFDNFFILEKKSPECEGVSMMKELSRLITYRLKTNGEVSSNNVELYNMEARAKVGLSKDFMPSDELIEYGQYLIAKEGRAEVTDAQIVKAKLLSSILRERVLHIDFDDLKTIEKGDTIGGKLPRVDSHGRHIYLLSQISASTFGASTCEIPLIISEAGALNIYNLYLCDRTIDFPEYYKKHKLELLGGLQKMVLEEIYKKDVNVHFCVIDHKLVTYTFLVKNFPDMKKEVEKANFCIKAGNTELPYEFLTNSVIL